MSTPKNDRTLRFCNEVLGLDHLHYGLWNKDDELTLDNLKHAQQRYEDYIVENIPNDVSTILDVGCGTGELSKRLVAAGYTVEGLSPDINQSSLYKEKTGQPFHAFRFEDYIPEKQFDCIIMSESGQYIPLDKLFNTAAKTLKPAGYLISIDYFILENATGAMAKSGHRLELFEHVAAAKGFRILINEDITEHVLKTLDILLESCNKLILAFEIATEKFRLKHPYVTRLVKWLTRKKTASMNESIELLDSRLFSEVKRYKLFVFQLGS